MKAKPAEVARALDKPGGPNGSNKNVRLFLLHGPDASGSNALAARLTAAIGPDAERIVLTPATLKADPARLADEAASFSLFGGARVLLVEGGGDELLDAVTGLLEASAAANPAIIVTGALKKTSKLLALAESSPHAMACPSYLPEGRDADRMVIDLGAAAGLRIEPDLARRLGEASGNDRALLGFELDKFALYLDAAPDRPATLEHAIVDALSANTDEGDVSTVVDAVLDGNPQALTRELAQLGPGTEPIVLLRALSRRLMLLARHRAEIDAGDSVDAVLARAGRSLFFKDKPGVTRQLGRWTSPRLAAALARILAAERDVKSPGSLGADAAAESLFAIAQASARRR